MDLKLILIILFGLGALFCSSKDMKNGKSKFIWWCTILLWLSAVLESVYYGSQNGGGADTLSYAQSFKHDIQMSFPKIWDKFIGRYANKDSENDVGFLLLEWFISRISSSYHFFRAVACLLFFIPFAKLLNRYCCTVLEVLFAMTLYLALFHTFAMYGARQFYAIGLGIMFFHLYSEKKYKSAWIPLLFAATIHMSSLLVLIPFGLSFLSGRTLRRSHLVALLLIPAAWIAANYIIFNMGEFIGMEKYAAYGKGEMAGNATTYILMSEVLSIICLVLTNLKCFNDAKFKYLYSMAPVFTFFAPLIASNGSMIRITIYSQIYITVLFPYLLHSRYGKKENIYIWALLAVLCFLIFRGGYIPYEFFWVADPKRLW